MALFTFSPAKKKKDKIFKNIVDSRIHKYVCCVLFCEGGRLQSVVVIGLCGVEGGLVS